MSSSTENQDPNPQDLADLSALADGTLDPARRSEVEARIAASPELSVRYERELQVVAMLRRARETDRAPARLREAIGAARPSKRTAVRRRAGWAGAFVAALAAVALALVLVLPAGTPGSPSVSQAAGLALLGPVRAAPAPDPREPGRLGQDLDEVYFPDWSRHGIQAVGTRFDALDGHRAMTVYYEKGGKVIAYTIVSAPALAQPAVRVTRRHGIELRTLSLNGRTVVTWRRGDNTCVLSAPGVNVGALQYLAAYRVPGSDH